MNLVISVHQVLQISKIVLQIIYQLKILINVFKIVLANLNFININFPALVIAQTASMVMIVLLNAKTALLTVLYAILVQIVHNVQTQMDYIKENVSVLVQMIIT